MRYHVISIRFRKKKIKRYKEIFLGANVTLVQPFGEVKLKIHMPYDIAIPFLVI